MSKSAVYAIADVALTTTATESIISFDTISRRFGCNCNLSGGNVVVRGSGYYDVDTSIKWTASGTALQVQVYDGGVAVPGASATMAVTSGESYVITLPAMIRKTCGCESTITVGITGAGVMNGASIRVEKL